MQNNQIRELIPIEDRNGQQAVNARHLYVWLGVRKDFSNWIKMQIKRCDLIENSDYQSFAQKGEREIGGTTRIEYALSLNAAKEISMMSQTEKGKEARRYFIECERKAMEKEKPMQVLPKDYKQALLQLVAQVEANEQLQLENKKLADKNDKQKIAIGLQKDIIKKLEDDNSVKQNIINLQSGELETLMPKGRVYDQVMQSPQDTSVFTTRQVAQEIGLSDHRLYAILMQIGVLYKQRNTYMLYADYLNWGLHKIVSHTIDPERGRVRTYLKWTTRGRAYIHALYDVNWDKRRAFNLLKKGNELQETEE